jgi:hypothetical protein
MKAPEITTVILEDNPNWQEELARHIQLADYYPASIAALNNVP